MTCSHRNFTQKENENKEVNKKGKNEKKEQIICEQYTNACKLRWARL